MATITLHGNLAERYGSCFELEVHSVLQAIQVIGASLPSFLHDVIASDSGFVVTVDGVEMQSPADMVASRLNPDIHIVPAIKGAGGDNNGLSTILLAAVVAVASYYLGPAGAGWLSSSGVQTGYAIAANLAISGVLSMMVSGQKDTDVQGVLDEQELTSYAFSGAVNTVSQGHPVPVLYGRLVVGSQVISAGVTAGA
ncbi:tail assembly protein [Ferribacterium limneticum]|uniref:hypothetical protein n=1 Tax=Ferribacterium limneticum TaxID=76259 RepID=UPI001CF82F55|nr:hypothetical protein [Ferribacterium limneticum]UCV26808.1 tail assembly protein [Ferribacterium limneticum]UCV30725.1 tail assembly protein [Ferribacterium limneticum]